MNVDKIMIDRVRSIVLNCVDTEGNNLDVIYEVNDGTDISVTLETGMYLTELDIKAKIKSFAVATDTYEEELPECSSEELDGFLEQFARGDEIGY